MLHGAHGPYTYGTFVTRQFARHNLLTIVAGPPKGAPPVDLR